MAQAGYLLGYDVGSSSIKATLLDAQTGAAVGSATSPKKEMQIVAEKPGWAEQHPDTWWENIVAATAEIKETAGVNLQDVAAIGISYQMHGLVLVDKKLSVLRPSIIWCDGRAVPYGEKALKEIGEEKCLNHLLNSPGNFTATKLAWVKENEPDTYKAIHKIMLPGDYIAMRLTGEVRTTPSGLSEGILWDFKKDGLADFVMEYFGFNPEFIPEVVPTFTNQGVVTGDAAAQLGIKEGTPVAYRGGDQPNNALSLNVLNPGEIAATAGTSGVVYGVADTPNYDPQSRVNTFVHVNHESKNPRYGILLCVNGTGILNSWLHHNVMSSDDTYEKMNEQAGSVEPGSQGLTVLPYGNGAERTLGNRNIGASIHGMEFNTHTKAHMLRAAQEGIVFALNHGLDIMKGVGAEIKKVRAGHANMFLSPIFSEAFATITGAQVELYNTDGSQGAARGAGIGAGIYADAQDAFAGLSTVKTIDPDQSKESAYRDAYEKWNSILRNTLNQ